MPDLLDLLLELMDILYLTCSITCVAMPLVDIYVMLCVAPCALMVILGGPDLDPPESTHGVTTRETSNPRYLNMTIRRAMDLMDIPVPHM